MRTQTQALINDDLLIDFGGDTYLHYLAHDLPLADISALLVTHWHSDHFYGEDLAYRMGVYGNGFDRLMTVYSTETVQEFYQRAFGLEQMRDPSRLAFETVRGGDSFDVVGGKYRVFVFDASHGHDYGDCVFFGVTDGESALLYMHDTGPITETAWRQLIATGLTYNYVSMDCTLGTLGVTSRVHMNLQENVQVRDKLFALGLTNEKTVFVANHFSHNARSTHEELERAAAEVGFVAAYDAMVTIL